MHIGESLVGDGGEAAHINTVLGHRTRAVSELAERVGMKHRLADFGIGAGEIMGILAAVA